MSPKKVGVRLDSVWAALVAANNSKTNQFKNVKKNFLRVQLIISFEKNYSLAIGKIGSIRSSR